MPPAPRHVQQVSVWQKLKMGALMGGVSGMAVGFLFGGWTVIRGGAGPRGAMATLSQAMLGSAAFFGTFFAIGSVIRNDDSLPLHIRDRLMLESSVRVGSRAEGYLLMKQRWREERDKQL
ncbi:reactive mitochondrial oxygen species modulator 1-domain-containing protein [Flagelloscypha sp. PMI_526]|nr:reactive mitochondrial oxygen species modulator 1-domain-containing protein [Flagelloscypha sp. PMI_526]